MKKIYPYIFSVLFLPAVHAQTTLDNAVDFTVTDTDGNTWNLFDLLNGGQYVCLDFFFTSCPPCQETGPFFKQAFATYGCNAGDVFFLSLDYGDDNMDVADFESQYLGGSPGYPVSSGVEGGATAIAVDYDISAFPTYILIAPDGSIVEKDMWPITSADDFTAYFDAHGLQQKACATAVQNTTSSPVSLYPNPVSGILYAKSSCPIRDIKVATLDGIVIQEEIIAEKKNPGQIDISNLPQGMYFVTTTDDAGNISTGKIIKQ